MTATARHLKALPGFLWGIFSGGSGSPTGIRLKKKKKKKKRKSGKLAVNLVRELLVLLLVAVSIPLQAACR